MYNVLVFVVVILFVRIEYVLYIALTLKKTVPVPVTCNVARVCGRVG